MVTDFLRLNSDCNFKIGLLPNWLNSLARHVRCNGVKSCEWQDLGVSHGILIVWGRIVQMTGLPAFHFTISHQCMLWPCFPVDPQVLGGFVQRQLQNNVYQIVIVFCVHATPTFVQDGHRYPIPQSLDVGWTALAKPAVNLIKVEMLTSIGNNVLLPDLMSSLKL